MNYEHAEFIAKLKNSGDGVHYQDLAWLVASKSTS